MATSNFNKPAIFKNKKINPINFVVKAGGGRARMAVLRLTTGK